jgi:aquaporin NIP
VLPAVGFFVVYIFAYANISPVTADTAIPGRKRAAALNLLLGHAQMVTATAGLLLLWRIGVNDWTVGLVAVAGLASVIRRLLFRDHPAGEVNSIMKRHLSEFLGTFALVFAGTGAIVINQVSGGTVTHVGIALTFGLVVLAMIYAFGDVSGAHLNPAVTVAFAGARRFPWRDVPGYVISQVLGALTASALLRGLFPANANLGATLPAGAAWQSLTLEVILTFLLMLVILSVSTGAKEKGITAGIAVGSVIALEALFAGPICGASMNPARSLAPALVSGHLQHLWVYLVAPTLGALLAVLACCGVREPGCCSGNLNTSG